MKKKLTLNQAWAKCLRQWKWIIANPKRKKKGKKMKGEKHTSIPSKYECDNIYTSAELLVLCFYGKETLR